MKGLIKYMKGLEISEKCFRESFMPAVEAEYGEAAEAICAGLCGGGSECYGCDDKISRDHDFSDGFYIWLTEDDDIRYGVGLSRIYRSLVKSEGRRSVEGRARGVCTVGSFYLGYLGTRGLPESLVDWALLPEYALYEACNGRVFCDNRGEFTRIREALLDIPEDVLRKKLACRLINMAQSGQYNYTRCLAHGERGAARFALDEFCKNAVSAAFLLNKSYTPYYKWALRKLSELDNMKTFAGLTEELLWEKDEKKCSEMIENICQRIARMTVDAGLCSQCGDYLEPYAYGVYNGIASRELKTVHIMEG